MSNTYNKYSKRSGWIDCADSRPEWQRKRGKRYGNNRNLMSLDRWQERRRNRRVEKKIDVCD